MSSQAILKTNDVFGEFPLLGQRLENQATILLKTIVNTTVCVSVRTDMSMGHNRKFMG